MRNGMLWSIEVMAQGKAGFGVKTLSTHYLNKK